MKVADALVRVNRKETILEGVKVPRGEPPGRLPGTPGRLWPQSGGAVVGVNIAKALGARIGVAIHYRLLMVMIYREFTMPE